MISEGSCDTEDWSNDAENPALHNGNKLHFTIYSERKRLFEFVKHFTKLLYFLSNKCSLGVHKRLLLKMLLLKQLTVCHSTSYELVAKFISFHTE